MKTRKEIKNKLAEMLKEYPDQDQNYPLLIALLDVLCDIRDLLKTKE